MNTNQCSESTKDIIIVRTLSKTIDKAITKNETSVSNENRFILLDYFVYTMLPNIS
jgi:hypothetical protein